MFIQLISFFTTFLLLIPISLFGIGGVYLALPILLFWFFISISIYRTTNVSKSYCVVFLSFVILLLFVLLVPVLHSQNYFDLIKMTFFGFFVFICCSILVYCYKVNFGENAERIILRNIYYIGTINAAVAVLVLAMPAVRGVVYSIVDTSPLNEVHLDIGMRSSGLFYFGGSIMSMFHCLIIYIAMIYASNYKMKVNLSDYLFVLINVCGIFVSGRFGFVFLLIMLFGIMLVPRNIAHIKKRMIINLFILSIISLSVLLLQYYDHFKRLLDWGLELFTNYLDNGKVESHSTEVLQTMYHFPSDLLFGNGIFSQIELATDSGFVLLMWYCGVISIIVYGILFFIHALNVWFSDSKYIKSIFFLCLTIILVGNFKDIYLFASNGVTQIYFITLLICTTSSRVFSKNEK